MKRVRMVEGAASMKVYVLIVAGAFGDLEAYSGVYSTPEKAMEAADKGPGAVWDAGTYTYGGGRYWRYRDNSGAWSGDAAVVREEEVK